MASLIADADEFRSYYLIDQQIQDALLLGSIRSAAHRLRIWVGEAIYTDALNEATENPERQAELKFAEATLAMHFALRGMNTWVTSGGVVRTSKAEGNVVNTYLSPQETDTLSRSYLDQAEEIARPYLLSDLTPLELGIVEMTE